MADKETRTDDAKESAADRRAREEREEQAAIKAREDAAAARDRLNQKAEMARFRAVRADE